MIKKSMLFLAIIMSSSCFSIPPKKNNQNFFTNTALFFLNFFVNKQPKRIESTPIPSPISKEFVCKEKADEIQKEREIKDALKRTNQPIKKEKISNITSEWEEQEEARINQEIKQEFERIKQNRYANKK